MGWCWYLGGLGGGGFGGCVGGMVLVFGEVRGWWVGGLAFSVLLGRLMGGGCWVLGAGRDGGGRGSIDTVVTVGSLCELRKYMENICPHLSLGKAWFEES